MLSASTELIDLCRSQVVLLTQGLGASLTIIYLAEDLGDTIDTKLVPIVAYPEIATTWQPDEILSLFANQSTAPSASVKLLNPAIDSSATSLPLLEQRKPVPADLQNSPMVPFFQFDEINQQQVVLPLLHEDAMLGLLVTARPDRPWNQREQTQIEQIAQTLAIACVLDQRGQWLERDRTQYQLQQAQQRDTVDTLLHQFRNPLTALRTFGKLLVRRLLPSDANRDVAESIVRESDRLQELLRQLETTVDYEVDLLSAAPALGHPAISPAIDRLAPRSQSLLTDGYLTGAQLQREPHLVKTILEPVLKSAQAIAQDRQLTLQLDLPDDFPPVLIDRRALWEVLSNIMDNALKYTPLGGTVVVQMIRQSSNRPPRQGILIADTGPGIPAQDREHLFERRYRGSQAHSSIPGSGLGLAIAQDLVHQMQGEIDVFSPATTTELFDPHHQLTEATSNPGTAIVLWFNEG